MTAASSINLAFVGSGGWARKYHFPALAHLQAGPLDLHLRGITSLEPAVARAVAEEYGFERVYADLDALLADEVVNAIAVAVPPAVLKGVLERIVPRGVPILSEKPPGINLREAQALSELVTVPNVLAFNRRYIPLNQRFKRIVDAMDGVYFVEGTFLRHRRTDEAFMIGTGIHWINFMAYVFGEIVDVQPERWPHPENATWLRVAHLRFASGLRGLFRVFPCSGSERESLAVHSSAQSVYLRGPLWRDPGQIVVEQGAATREVIAPEAEAPLPETVRLGIVGEYQEFCAVALGKAVARSTFQNAVNSMWVAEVMEVGAVTRQDGESSEVS